MMPAQRRTSGRQEPDATEEVRPRPLVGVGVLVLRENRVLLGRRRAGHGSATWHPPGGHLEFGESIEHCARREVREEAGLSIGDVVHGPYTNDLFADEGRHYVSLFVVTRVEEGEPYVLEPDKIEQWGWYRWDALPEPLFPPLERLYASGYDPFVERPWS